MIEKFVPKMKFIAGRSGLLLKKYSPDILFGLGVSGMIGSAVMASKASVRFNDVRQDRDTYISRGLTTLGQAGIDEDSRVTVLIHPMSQGIGGYFNSGDEYSLAQNSVSNERETFRALPLFT